MTQNPRLRAVIAVVAVLVALTGSWLLGRATRSDGAVGAAPGSSSSSTISPSDTTSQSASDTSSPSPDATASTPSPSSPHSAVEAGRTADFGYARSYQTVSGVVHLRFDRAILLTSKAANDYAAAHSMATPVPNDYLVVNDSHKLRDLVLSSSVTVTGTAILSGTPSPTPVTLAYFLSKVKTTPDIPLNITYNKNLLVVKIAEQFFP
jgi:hypothetical protein